MIPAFLREAAGVAARAGAVAIGLAAALAAGRIAFDGGVVPPPGPWIALVACGIGATSASILPIVAALAAVLPLARWTDDGAWTGLRSLGTSGRSLLPAWTILGFVAGLSTAAATHGIEPGCRQAARGIAARAARIGVVPGIGIRIGDATLLARASEGGIARDVLLEGPGWLASAASARRDGGDLVLVHGSLRTSDPAGTSVVFEEARRPVDPPRRDLAERWTPDLARAVDATEAAGRDASYERAIGWKRWTIPFLAALVPAALGPLGARGRPVAAVVAAGMLVLGAVRLGDHLAAWIGPLAASLAGPAAVAALGALAWATWRDR